uniref:fluoride efflux transporter CrcB n=1 Tax=Ningiella ruwaisensis TaxID=2364274 RepID=UPI0010A02723|nr:fluoride efflux transporter CrcB [Ningiella ruwaisensis]
MTITWLTYVYVAIGGAIGACLRLFTNVVFINLLGKSSVFATLSVNVVGSFCIGLAYAHFMTHSQINDDLKMFIIVGILGALTTFSTFSLEVLLLLQQGEWLHAVITVFLNVCLCVLAVWCAMMLIKG